MGAACRRIPARAAAAIFLSQETMQQTEDTACEQGEKEEAQRDPDGKNDSGESGAQRSKKSCDRETAASRSRKTHTAGQRPQPAAAFDQRAQKQRGKQDARESDQQIKDTGRCIENEDAAGKQGEHDKCQQHAQNESDDAEACDIFHGISPLLKKRGRESLLTVMICGEGVEGYRLEKSSECEGNADRDENAQ